MHLYSLTILRAVAITMVVIGHCHGLGNLSVDTVGERFAANLVAGATVIFVFVSGFLFNHIFQRKFVFGRFYQKKVQNVLLPYVLLTSLGLALGIGQVWAAWPSDGAFGAAAQMVFMYGTGHVMMAYWYIPFIMLTFAMSPLHVRFSQLSLKWQGVWMLGLLALALVLHRPALNVNPFQSVIYFAPVYLFGIVCSQHKARIYEALEGKSLYFLGGTVFLAWLQAWLGTSGNYYRTSLGFEGIDLMLLQKLCMCVFLMVFLHKFEDLKSNAVDVLANTSFAIFFLHPIVLHYAYAFRDRFLVDVVGTDESWMMYLVGGVCVVAICVTIASALKVIAGQRSRMVIGY